MKRLFTRKKDNLGILSFLPIFLFANLVSLGLSAQSQNNGSRGIFESYVVLNIKGAGNVFYDLHATTGNPDFHGASLGSFCSTETLNFSGGENKTYKNSGCNILNGDIFYRVWLTSSGATGSFTQVNLPFSANIGGTSGNEDQRWQRTNNTANLINGLAPGNYTLEVYTRAQFNGCGTGDLFTNRNTPGENYRATFTVRANPAISGISAGANPICVDATTSLTANGIAGDGASLTWFTETGGAGTNLGSSNPLTNRAPGTYYARVTGTCSPAVEASITIGSTPAPVWYKDADNDGYSDGSTLTQCTQPANYKLPANLTGTTGDCDDADATFNPATIWYLDADNDLYYSTSVTQCTSPGTGYKTTGLLGGGDCNDNNSAINPSATEVCDGVDNNCDGNTDEGGVCPSGTISGATSVNCYNDFTVKLTVAGSGGVAPYTYLWNTGKSGDILTGAGAGTYTCTITDQNGNSFVASHTINQPTAVTGTLVITGQKCLDPNKGSIVVNATGGTPGYTYALNFGTYQTSNTFLNLDPAKYKVNIKDANGCPGILNAVVTQLRSTMTMTAVRVGVTTCGAATGSITVTAGSGVAPYQYQLGTGAFQSSGAFTGLTAGAYTVTAKDAVGCTITRSYTVPDNGSDIYEANNSIGAAKVINVSQNVVARIGTATDTDWFRFSTGAGTSFDITMSHPSVTYTFKLFTSAGVEVIPASSGSGIKSYTGLLPATVYRIQVTGAQSLVCYNLMVSPSAPAPVTEMLTAKEVETRETDGLAARPYPNPHRGEFVLQIESPVSGKGNIVLYDVQGRTVVSREENLRAGTNQVRFSNLQPINYFYRVMVGNKATSGKVFRQ